MDNLQNNLNRKEIGKKISSKRKELKLSQEYISNILGISKSTIQEYESGTIKIMKLSVLKELSYVLKINFEWLIGLTEEKSKDKIENTFSDYEQKLLCAYRNKPEMQSAVNTLLGIKQIPPDLEDTKNSNETVFIRAIKIIK